MYKMMIVEDEPWIRKAIERVLPWGELGIEVVCQAGNGEEALEKLGKYELDILLTDIRMPKMDGIALLKSVQDNVSPCPQTIVLTGYNDFTYVKEALKYSAADYILKPIDPEELRATIAKVTAKLDEQRRMRKEITKLSLGNYLFEFLADPAANTTGSFEFGGRPFALVTTDGPVKGDKGRADDGVECYAYALTFGMLFVLLFSRHEDAETQLEQFKEGLGSAAFGCSSIYKDFHQFLPIAYEEARGQLNDRLFTREPQAMETDQTILTQEQEKQLLQLIPDGDLDGIFSFIDRCLTEQVCFDRQWTITFQLYTLFTRYLHKDRISSRYSLWMREIRSARTLEDLLKLIEQFIHPLIRQLAKEWTRDSSETVRKIQQYIDRHYANSSLSLTQVADEFHFSPSYVSFLFKNEVNINFITYLTDRRLEKAKELLTRSNDQISAISESVGFNDVKYFNRVFKKTTGLTPKQFRENLKR